jgi:hypothetical protein
VDLVRFTTEGGSEVLVETSEGGRGFEEAGAGNRIANAKKSFAAALADIADAADTALVTLRDRALQPDGIEIELGVRFTAESGAVIAKAAMEGNLKLKLVWGAAGARAAEESAGANQPDTTDTT